MRILLDECIDERFRHEFTGHECQTARFAKLTGLKNGKLLASAESLGFDVLITVDQGIPYQQNIAARRIAVIVICAPSNRLKVLRTWTGATLAALAIITPGQVSRLG